jgi:Protein of unknown function DUF262
MRLGPLLDGPRQFVVPYFQRTYSWRRQQWNTLFEDILELYELNTRHSHFLGSMVLLGDAPNEGVESTLVIDGQQRLVTLSLFLAAVRDIARGSLPDLAESIHSKYLVNGAHVKVLCTHQDRAAFATVVERGQEPEPSPIRDAYRSFRTALDDHLQQGVDLQRLTHIVASQLSFVAITLDGEDNPYRIFESLNAKGMPLTQGDLLRNYFFMRLPPSEHETWYSTVWSPMQRRLGDRFDDYMRDYLVKEGTPVKPDEVYQEWRKRLTPLDDEAIRATLRDLAQWSLTYDQILHPQREMDAGVRKQLARLTAWSRTVVHPFEPLLLRLHADYRANVLSAEQMREMLLSIESFFVRRLFTSAPQTDENQLLIQVYNSVASAGDRAQAFVDALSRPQVGWPDDAAVLVHVVRYPLYFGSHPDQRKLIFEALEDSYPHTRPMTYDQLELQLITPLLPREDWLNELGVSERDYWSIVGTLGNFTWVPRGRAPDLGVAERKKELLRMTRYELELVRDFASIERWTVAEIEARSKRLGERAVSVWPGPLR